MRLGQLGPRHPDLQCVWWVLMRGIRCVVSSAERLTLPRQAYDSDERYRNSLHMFQIETGIWLGYRLLRALCVLCTAPQRAASAQGTRRSRLEACCRLCGCSRCLLSLFSLRCALCCVLTGHWSLAIAALCACVRAPRGTAERSHSMTSSGCGRYVLYHLYIQSTILLCASS